MEFTAGSIGIKQNGVKNIKGEQAAGNQCLSVLFHFINIIFQKGGNTQKHFFLLFTGKPRSYSRKQDKLVAVFRLFRVDQDDFSFWQRINSL